MKWLPPAGSTQRSTCGRYLIMRANPGDWVAYYLGRQAMRGVEIGVRRDEEQAREFCQQYEINRVARS